jgi:tripartite-type tricarboxylate transporter receptor subunit TctC
MAWLSKGLLVLAALCGAAPFAHAQPYPERVVEIVLPYSPGGGADLQGRALAEGLSAALGQRFLIINKQGANGAIGTAAVARAAPDGYTLLFTAAVSMVVNPLTQPQTDYTIKSFDHLCQTFKNEMAIVVHPDSPLKSVRDLVAASKQQPGGLNYGILGIGSIPHLVMVELSQVADVRYNAVPFKGDADVLQQVAGRHVDFGSVTLASAAKSGMRILGVFARQRNPGIPDVPTVIEQGFEVAPASIGGLSAPAGLPGAIKSRLEQACSTAAKSEAYLRLQTTLHQPVDYYASGSDYTQALDQDLTAKRRLLGQLGMLR